MRQLFRHSLAAPKPGEGGSFVIRLLHRGSAKAGHFNHVCIGR